MCSVPTHFTHRRTSCTRSLAAQRTALAGLTQGIITPEQMKAHVDEIKGILTPVRVMVDAQARGVALQIQSTNMDFSNSLQMAFARDFVI